MEANKMKNKLYVILYIVILLSTVVYAGKIDLYSLKVYANNERLKAEWDDEGWEINPDTTMELQIRFENTWNETIELTVEGTLFEIGDDIERSKDIDIEKGKKQAIVFEYFIPADTREDIYDLEIRYEYDAYDYNLNTTIHHENEKKFEVEIVKKTTKEEDIWINISRNLVAEKERTNDLLNTVLSTHNLSIRLADCERDLGDNKLNNDFKSKYEGELNKSRDYESKFNVCDTEKKNMYSQSQLDSNVLTAETNAKREQKSKDDWQTLIVAAAIIIYNMFQKKKEKVGGKGEGVSVHGAKWR